MSLIHRLPVVLVSLTLFLVLVLRQLNSGDTWNENTLAEQASPVLQELNEDEKYDVEERPPVLYAVFGSSTPNGENYRSYDYAFNLPLTALAWERLGFRSVVLIIGSRCEWENDPALSYILSHLEARRAIIIFIASPLEQRSKLSQTARPFTVNLPGFPGRDNDYLITSDSDLWPLRKEHYVPRPNMDIVLVHSTCCRPFKMNNQSYPMYPMSNIGATVSIWRQVMNDNHSIADDADTILNYLEDVFGDMARGSLIVGQPTWYMDQRMTSIRLTEWMQKYGNESVYRVSDVGFSRFDRLNWNVATTPKKNFLLKYDAHMPLKMYLPAKWNSVRPLMHWMYGAQSWQTKWCEDYASGFLNKVKNYMRLQLFVAAENSRPVAILGDLQHGHSQQVD
ncbi:hypothetical protein GHT06_016101 [Daphnia sinensis]|uniref:Uncharacterized protein n=1 Tax=Daphnia sinensis TaxID=1820382 RepID=A0AAD5KUG1_9CRUS|nr:hypothetical protein GHT06_016101 [Daphnia sinensis]